jgi:hypothetical protein
VTYFFPFRSSESRRLLPHGVGICDLQSVDYQVGPELLGDHPTFRSLPASFRYGRRRVAREVQRRRGCWACWASSRVALVTHRPFRKVEGDRAVCKFAWALPSQPICRPQGPWAVPMLTLMLQRLSSQKAVFDTAPPRVSNRKPFNGTFAVGHPTSVSAPMDGSTQSEVGAGVPLAVYSVDLSREVYVDTG